MTVIMMFIVQSGEAGGWSLVISYSSWYEVLREIEILEPDKSPHRSQTLVAAADDSVETDKTQ